MKILEIRVLRGPNYWSCYRKDLIDMRLDLEEYEEIPTNKIDGFAARLEALLPSMREHQCSELRERGFFDRVRQGTWMGHVIEHIALEIQSLAGMFCGFGRTRSAGIHGVYHVVFSYTVEMAGRYAAEAAVRIAQALAQGKDYDVNADIDALSELNREYGPGPSTRALLYEAKKKDIPWRMMEDNSYIILGHGKNQKIIRAALTSDTSIIGVDIAGDKYLTKKILAEQAVPVPKGRVVYNRKQMLGAVDDIGFPIVIKPSNGNHGRGVTTRIKSLDEAERAFEQAIHISSEAIVEQFMPGDDYRFLVINYKLVAVAKRIPAMIQGDGIRNIEELIAEVNEDPRRGDEHEKILTRIKIDDNTLTILRKNNLQLDSVLPNGEVLFLKDTANLSTGGTSRDVTHLVHPENIWLAERIARLVNLDICGIDFIAEDIRQPVKTGNGGVVEVNASPGLRMHLSPTKGLPQNVAEPILDMLYPDGKPARIPIVAVTGTNGKTTTTRLIAHLAEQAGHQVGYTTTEGIYICGHQIESGDCSGPDSAFKVLRDPLVDFAVLECARGGILRAGLGFDKCSTSIITNISEDHLGLDYIDTLEKLARVKSVVAYSTSRDGFAILNADDDLVYGLYDELDCKIALFSMQDKNERVKSHCARGGMAAIIEKGYFTICRGNWRTRFARVDEIPLTLNGRAGCMTQNVLAALLAAVVNQFDPALIQKALKSFLPSKEFTPGRMNIFNFPGFTLMVDYAHNRDGFCELKKFLAQTPASVKVGIIASPGDRRDEDIRNVGACAAEMFDEIIIKHDKDGRGRSRDEITELFRAGIESVDANIPVTVISNELESVRYAINTAREGSFIVVCTECVNEVLDFVNTELEQVRVPV